MSIVTLFTTGFLYEYIPLLRQLICGALLLIIAFPPTTGSIVALILNSFAFTPSSLLIVTCYVISFQPGRSRGGDLLHLSSGSILIVDGANIQ